MRNRRSGRSGRRAAAGSARRAEGNCPVVVAMEGESVATHSSASAGPVYGLFLVFRGPWLLRSTPRSAGRRTHRISDDCRQVRPQDQSKQCGVDGANSTAAGRPTMAGPALAKVCATCASQASPHERATCAAADAPGQPTGAAARRLGALALRPLRHRLQRTLRLDLGHPRCRDHNDDRNDAVYGAWDQGAQEEGEIHTGLTNARSGSLEPISKRIPPYSARYAVQMARTSLLSLDVGNKYILPCFPGDSNFLVSERPSASRQDPERGCVADPSFQPLDRQSLCLACVETADVLSQRLPASQRHTTLRWSSPPTPTLPRLWHAEVLCLSR